jgi:hypothetical protein
MMQNDSCAIPAFGQQEVGARRSADSSPIMSDQEHSASLMVLEALVLLMIEKGVLEREEVIEALEAASAALTEGQAEPTDTGTLSRIAKSVRSA